MQNDQPTEVTPSSTPTPPTPSANPAPPTPKSGPPRVAIIGAVVAVVLILAIGGVAIINAGKGKQTANSQPTATATSQTSGQTTPATDATATPDASGTTGTPSPTAKPGSPSPTPSTPPQIITSATLGGTLQAIQTTYQSSNGVFHTSDPNVVFSVDVDNTGPDGQLRVLAIHLYKQDGSTWTQSAAKALAVKFEPSDAQFQRATTHNGNPQDVYMSNNLGASIAATWFGSNAKGTFAITYVQGKGAVTQCVIAAGTN